MRVKTRCWKPKAVHTVMFLASTTFIIWEIRTPRLSVDSYETACVAILCFSYAWCMLGVDMVGSGMNRPDIHGSYNGTFGGAVGQSCSQTLPYRKQEIKPRTCFLFSHAHTYIHLFPLCLAICQHCPHCFKF